MTIDIWRMYGVVVSANEMLKQAMGELQTTVMMAVMMLLILKVGFAVGEKLLVDSIVNGMSCVVKGVLGCLCCGRRKGQPVVVDDEDEKEEVELGLVTEVWLAPSALRDRRSKVHVDRNCRVIKDYSDGQLRRMTVCDHCLRGQRDALRARDDDARGGNKI